MDDDGSVQLFAKPRSSKKASKRKHAAVEGATAVAKAKHSKQSDHNSSSPPAAAAAAAKADAADAQQQQPQQQHEGNNSNADTSPSEAAAPAPASTFQELGVSDWLCAVLASLGIKQPTQVQVGCIPAILAGRNVIGTAQTGSGKTAAFALPILQQLARDPYGVYCLVLTPTRCVRGVGQIGCLFGCIMQ